MILIVLCVFFFKQKTAYEMRISDWSSDVCSSDLWPRAILLNAWGTANMRTGGDDIAQALALIGARPTWEGASGRVTGFEIVPIDQIGRASCRERVCQYVYISVVAVSFKKKKYMTYL